jgi:Tfp pilus assembly protein PilE
MLNVTLKRGVTMIETITYVIILGILMTVIVEVTSAVLASDRQVEPVVSITASASTALERISREIRGSLSIATSSILSQNPGTLVLETTTASGTAKTVALLLNPTTNQVELWENGVFQGPLTTSGVTVTSLIFHHLTSGNSQAIRVELAMTSGAGDYAINKNWQMLVALRTN